MLIGSIILFHIFLIFFFYCISEIYEKFKLNSIKSIIFGYSIFIISNYYFYFIFKINIFYILIIWLLIFLISFFLIFKRLVIIKKIL